MKKVSPWARAFLALAGAFFLAACASAPRRPAAPALRDVQGIDGLRAAFIAADGQPRVVLLLSPT